MKATSAPRAQLILGRSRLAATLDVYTHTDDEGPEDVEIVDYH